MSKLTLKKLKEIIKEELAGLPEEVHMEKPDHEGRMARGEIGGMLQNGKKLYELIGEDDELPGWVSAYITLASDYINSVTQYMVENSKGSADAEQDKEV